MARDLFGTSVRICYASFGAMELDCGTNSGQYVLWSKESVGLVKSQIQRGEGAGGFVPIGCDHEACGRGGSGVLVVTF